MRFNGSALLNPSDESESLENPSTTTWVLGSAALAAAAAGLYWYMTKSEAAEEPAVVEVDATTSETVSDTAPVEPTITPVVSGTAAVPSSRLTIQSHSATSTAQPRFIASSTAGSTSGMSGERLKAPAVANTRRNRLI